MTDSQTQLFDNTGAQKVGAGVSVTSPSRPQYTLQDYLPQESVLAVKEAVQAGSLEDFRKRLETALPQNSAATRRRYVESLSRWFFRDGLHGFAPTVWARFQNVELQLILHRYLYLSVEPIVAASVTAVLGRLSEGIIVPTDYVAVNTAKSLAHELTADTRKRLLTNLRRLGFLERTYAGDRVVAPTINKTALLLAFHHAFSIDEPRAIEFSTLAANPFWQFIGLRSEDSLRDFFKEAEHAGLLGKYVIADRLEQVTTCHSLTTLIQKGVTL